MIRWMNSFTKACNQNISFFRLVVGRLIAHQNLRLFSSKNALCPCQNVHVHVLMYLRVVLMRISYDAYPLAFLCGQICLGCGGSNKMLIEIIKEV